MAILAGYGRYFVAGLLGAVLAVSAGVAVFRVSGFEWLCLHQVLCTVSNSSSWASQIHLSWTGDPSSGLTVTWSLPEGGPASAEYRRAGEEAWQRVAAEEIAVAANGIFARRGSYRRAVLSGLESDTAYEYRVSNAADAEEAMSAVFSARTAPAGDDARFSFLFFADTGLIGRPDDLSSGTDTLRRYIADSDASFLLGGGDYAYGNSDGRYVFPPDAADTWFRQWQPVLTRLPLMAQYGNHEVFLREGLSDWLPRFGHPPGYGDGRAYSFDVGSVHFTAMFAPGDGYLPPDDLLVWLDADLARARQDGATWLIVYQHDSLFGHGLSHPADPRLRALLMPILEKHGVDLHIAAQDQSYERTYPLTGGADATVASSDPGSYVAGEGVVYVKVSPAGKMSERTHDFSLLTAPQPDEIAVRSDAGFHLAEIAVDGTASLEVTVRQWRPGADAPSVLDRFIITRPRQP